MKWYTLFFCFVIATFSIEANQTDGSTESPKPPTNDLPEFKWKDEATIDVKLPNGEQDEISLWPAEKVGDVDVPCLFEGTLKGERNSDVVVSGCWNHQEVSITIHSRRLDGRTMFVVKNGATEEIENPYKGSGNSHDYEDEEDRRGKRDVNFEDYVQEDYDDEAAFDTVEPPSILQLNMKVGYEESLKQHLGGDSASRAYAVEVFTHARSYMRSNPLGESHVHLNLVQAPAFVANKTWTASRESLTDAKTTKTNEAVPAVYFCFDGDSDELMGVSSIRKGCDPTNGVAIIKWRRNVLLAANTLNHECGHLMGLQHDKTEDMRNAGAQQALCHGTGVMSEMAPTERPTHFSTCSSIRFRVWYNNFGKSCLKDLTIPENMKTCRYPLIPSTIHPCMCKVDHENKVHLLCDSMNIVTLNAIANIFECKNEIHKLEINMMGDDLNCSFTSNTIGILKLDSFRLYNVGKMNGDLGANSFIGSSETLRKINLTSLQISKIPKHFITNMTNLAILDLSNNEISSISIKTFENLPSLTEIYLNDNNISSLHQTFENFPSLTKIYLNRNRLTMLPKETFRNLPSLTKIYLNGNKISMLPKDTFKNLPSLTKIYLNGNKISLLQKETFNNLPSLTEIYLNNNKIIIIQSNAFTNLPALRILDLSHNDFEEIRNTLVNVKNPDMIVNLSKTKIQFLFKDDFQPFVENILAEGGEGYIDVESLSLQCSCDVHWLHNQSNSLGISKFHNALCTDGYTLEEVDSKILDTDCPSENCPGVSSASLVLPTKLTLVGGNGFSQGNVFYNGKPVCDDSWDFVDGAVVCRDLGFSGVSSITTKSKFGNVSKHFGMDDVKCAGTEFRLDDCYYITEEKENCGTTEGAGVICNEDR